jgi:hypothetical protein
VRVLCDFARTDDVTRSRRADGRTKSDSKGQRDLVFAFPDKRVHFPFAFSPNSISRRIASDRVAPFLVAHASMAAIVSGGTRDEINGSLPVAGRPVFFIGTKFDFAML